MEPEDISELGLLQSGLKARSPEGHAARAMHIKGDEYVWVEIQEKTFTNWVNEQLRGVGMTVTNLQTDFVNGLKLIALIEVLQKRKLKKIKRPLNQHQYLENVQIALNAMADDSIKLVNIGNTDIVEGNLKLILGLIWSLILRYQIGRSNFPPKKLMLAWLQAVLPDLNIANFTSDWKSGIALSALLDYCQPGAFHSWRTLDSKNSVENCRKAMLIARDAFSIPMILTPEDLASHNMDELSGMTYFSYFMKEDSPGYKSTLQWVSKQLGHQHVRNFTTDWNNGLALCSLVRSLGANVPSNTELKHDRAYWEQNLQYGINGGIYLGVDPLLKAKEMADPEVEHLGVMAYIARFQGMKPVKRPRDKISITGTDLNNVYINKPAHFKINLLDSSVALMHIKAEVKSSSGNVDCKLNISKNGGTGVFIPTESGMHELCVYCEGEIVSGCPLNIKVHPDISKILFSGIDPCALGSIVEVLINSNGAGGGSVNVKALSPSGKSRLCPVTEKDGVYTATFTPNEIGEWKIMVTYSGEHIHGSPFTCYVYDPAQVKVHGLGEAFINKEMVITCDASSAGWGEVKIELKHGGVNVPIHIDERGNGIYRISFTPNTLGKHLLYTTFNGIDVKGSPFMIEVVDSTKDGKSREYEAQSNRREKIDVTRDTSYNSDWRHDITRRSLSSELSSSSNKLNGFSKSNDRLSSKLSSGYSADNIFESSVNRMDIGEKLQSHGTANTSAWDNQKSKFSIKSEIKDDILSSKSSKLSSDIRSSSSEEMSFHEKAELVNNKLNARNEESKPLKSPPPPTAKKPVGVDITTRSWSSRDHKANKLDKVHPEPLVTHTKNIHESSSYWKDYMEDSQNTSKDHYHYSHKDEDVRKQGLGAKPKVHPKIPSWDSHAESHLPSSSTLDNFMLNSSSRQLDHKAEQRHHRERDTYDSAYSQGAHKVKKELVDLRYVIAEGEGLKLVPVKQPTLFTLSAPMLRQDDISITVTAPSGKEVPFHLEALHHSKYQVEYITAEVGEHIIDVLICGRALPSSPFHCYAYDATQIKVGKIPNGVVGKPVEFEIDGAEAGSGNLEILVNGGHVTSNVKNLGNHCFLASFIPHTATTHSIEMKFNGHPVPGSPWKCEVSDTSRKISARGETLQAFSTGRTASFEVHASDFHKQDINVNIRGPTKAVIQHKLTDLRNGIYRVDFNTHEVGSYTIDVMVGGQKISGSPFLAKAYNAGQVRISNVPEYCEAGEICQFNVDASQAGEGQLEISVNDGKVPNQVQVLGSGKCLVSFTPEVSEPHTIDIKFNGENVPGCPVILESTDSELLTVDLMSLELIPIDRPAYFTVNLKRGQDSDLKVLITSPSNMVLPVKIKGNSQMGITVEFIPKEVGPHTVTVEHGGKKVSGTPYTVKVYDAQRVKVSGMPHGTLGKTVQFTVDASHAGEGNLEITVSGKGRNIPTQVHPLGSAKFGVSFVPTEPVEHIISISFNKEPVPGSSFRVSILDSGKVSATGSALIAAPLGKSSSFLIQNIRGREQDLTVKVEGPDGNIIPCGINDNGSHAFKVDFTPIKTGEHKIHIYCMDAPIQGSPFISKVYDIKQIKVREIPKGSVGKPVTFYVETSHAGPGNLEVMVNNGQVPTVPHAQSSNLYAISFTPKEVKSHVVELKFNGEHVPGSPFECSVIDLTKVRVKGDGLERVCVGRTSSFVIDCLGMDVGEVHTSVFGPNQNPVKTHMSGSYQSGYRVEYTATEVGDHTVDVRIEGQLIANSPFLVKAYDAQKVKVNDVNTGIVGKPVYFSIDASQAGAGNLEIIVSVGGRNVPNYVQSEGNAKFRVNFKPTEAQTHILSVKFNGEAVPGSPFYVVVSDSNQSVVTGSSLRMTSLSRGAHFSVDTRGLENSECKVNVTGPSGKKLPVSITKISTTTFDIQFSPVEVGPHSVAVTLDGSPILGSPFTCNVYDVSKVKVSKLNPGAVGKPCTFQVDASQAGEGTLELVVTTRKSSVRAEVSMKSRGLYDVTFVPQDRIPHYVNITFNEEDVLGSPFKIEVQDAMMETKITKNKLNILANGEGLKQGLVGSINVFDIDVNGLDGEVDVKVTGPSGVPVQTSMLRTEQGTHRVEYQSREVGTYKVEVFHAGTSISGKPFLVEVCDPSRVKVIDVEDGIVGREQTFKVDASRAGRGTLALTISAAGREVRHTAKEISPGIYQATYTPRSDHPHKIDVYYNGHQAPGCPQIVDIRDPSNSIIAHGTGLKSAAVGKTSSFLIETGGFGEAKDFDIVVIGPAGSPLPVKCYQQKDGSLLVEWSTQKAGIHKIEALYRGKPIAGSPFSCQVFDANQISIQKVKNTTFSVNERISFTLNRKDAGYAELDVTVTSPLGRHLPIEVKGTPDGEGELIEFTPTVPGKYKIGITYGGIEVPGSPVTFIAQEGESPRVEGSGLTAAQCGSPAVFKILAKGLWGQPDVQVDGPECVAKSTIEEKEEGIFVVSYVPQEVGIYDIKVLWNGREVPGSPFHPRVVNTQKVRIIGGLENILDEQNHIPLTIGEERKLPFDVSEAGPGKLKTEVHGQNGVVNSRLEQTGSHRYLFSFIPVDEGEHYIYVSYADLPLSASPFVAYAEETNTSLDHTRVVLRGHGLTGARVNEEAEFVIDGSEAGPGSPDVSLSGVKADIPVRLVSLGNNIFKAFYIPTVQGAYLLNVMWSQRHVKGCPLKVTVTTNCDAAKVNCSGDGLRGGTMGKEIKAFIDTRKAGPGELTAHCMGSHKVAYCELYDHRDGTFTLYIKPQEGGRHILTVKYGGEHVPGSPFTLRIAGAPDASKVRVYGPGIEPGVLASYQSRFICDTRGAGAGQLTVRIRGPKGAFRVEMQRESQKDRTILCKYDPTEPGDYRIEVKWSGEHVPGSPFVVMIFDTQEELNHYLQGQYHNSGAAGSLPAADYFGGSMTYSTGFGEMSWRGSTAEL